MVVGADEVVLVDNSVTANDSKVGVVDSESSVSVEASGCTMPGISIGTGVVNSKAFSSVVASGCLVLGTSVGAGVVELGGFLVVDVRTRAEVSVVVEFRA